MTQGRTTDTRVAHRRHGEQLGSDLISHGEGNSRGSGNTAIGAESCEEGRVITLCRGTGAALFSRGRVYDMSAGLLSRSRGAFWAL